MNEGGGRQQIEGITLARRVLEAPLDVRRPLRAVAIGEVGLLGELRSVAGLERRLREAARLGFTTAIVPRPARAGRGVDGAELEVIEVATLREAIGVGLGDGPRTRGDAIPAMLG